MEVRFIRSGERRYAITAVRSDGPVMELPQAPGFDAWLPHDLAHFLVERHFQMRGGIFGQLAAGGDAGTFMTTPRRLREVRANRVRSDRLGRLGREEVARSERLAGALTAAFCAEQGSTWRHAEAVDERELGRERSRLTRVAIRESQRWHGLQVGQSMSLNWPKELRAPRYATQAPRRPG